MEESKLEPDVGTVDAELPDVHPCEIVQTTGFGIFGRPTSHLCISMPACRLPVRLGEGDGKNSPPNLLYKARCPGQVTRIPCYQCLLCCKDWIRCMQGDINRDMLSGYMEFGNSLYHSIASQLHYHVPSVTERCGNGCVTKLCRPGQCCSLCSQVSWQRS